jgi:hypothetical protein
MQNLQKYRVCDMKLDENNNYFYILVEDYGLLIYDIKNTSYTGTAYYINSIKIPGAFSFDFYKSTFIFLINKQNLNFAVEVFVDNYF